MCTHTTHTYNPITPVHIAVYLCTCAQIYTHLNTGLFFFTSSQKYSTKQTEVFLSGNWRDPIWEGLGTESPQ